MYGDLVYKFLEKKKKKKKNDLSVQLKKEEAGDSRLSLAKSREICW